VIEAILPAAVVVEEARKDTLGFSLSSEESAALGRAVEKRRREFTTARLCARRALARLDLPPASIPSGPHGEPLWPAGVVGSITHCDGYRACALARRADLFALGIDAEPNEPLPAGVLDAIACSEEHALVRRLARLFPAAHWDRLLFSAKESIYKAWFPLVGRPLGFEDARLTIDPRRGVFSARLLVSEDLPRDLCLRDMTGRWLARDGLLFTAIAITRA
jgi:4'-phosphopantetheinyl transferase EntD